MDVRIHFMGVIARVTGEKEVALSFDGTPTVRALMDSLESRYGEKFATRVYRTSTTPRRLQLCMRIFVNRRLVDDRALDESLPLLPGEKTCPEVLVYLLPAACGG